MMQFKWHSYASYVFKLQFFGYLVLLVFVSVASFGLPRLCEDAHTAEVCPVHLRDDEEDGYGATPNRAPGYMFKSALGVVTFVSLVFAALGSVGGLALAMRQLVVDGSDAYFNNTFNCIDVIAYGSEILVVLLFFANAPMASVLPVSAWGVLLFFIKILGFARGFDKWGPLVRMIAKIVADTRQFFMVMAIIVFGFSMSFIALGDGVVRSFFWVFNTGLFQLGAPEDVDPTNEQPIKHWMLLFEFLMVTVSLILLNLLIAIMNSTYESVHAVAELEVAYEKSRIIFDIERFMLPVIMSWAQIDVSLLFPRWLHMCVPVTMHEAERKGKQARLLAESQE